MKIEVLQSNPNSLNFDYLERKVNNGLKGGTKYLNNVSLKYNPFHCSKMKIPYIVCPNTSEYGILPKGLQKNTLFYHPDNKITDSSHYIEGIPTASSRTIRTPSINGYLKLSYPFNLGRVNKRISKSDIICSLSNSDIISKIIIKKRINKYLSLFPETYGAIYNYLNEDIGYIYRSSERISNNLQKTTIIVPAFSLFGTDDNNDDPSIIKQLNKNNVGVGKNFLEYLIFPIIDCYFQLLFFNGIELEMHPQNFLLGFDKDWNLTEVIIRDMESINIDINIMKYNGLSYNINSSQRILNLNDNYYYEKHSFRYDHKFGEFFLLPLLNEISNQNINEINLACEKIRKYVNFNYGEYLNKWFPKEFWYRFDDIYIVDGIERRVFLANKKPMFR